MNPFFDVPEQIVIDGIAVKLPTVDDNQDMLSASLTFRKPSWMPDSESNVCLNCKLKFTPLRRKHHCRNCGKLFCFQCCLDKIPLPHFGMNEVERVCNNCKLIVELMVILKGEDQELKYEAIIGLSNLIKTVAGLCKVLECGGIHIMLSLAMNGDVKIKSAIASTLHCILQNMMLHDFLLKIGCLRVLKNFLSSSSDSHELLSNSLSSLNLICRNGNGRAAVLQMGLIDSLMMMIHFSGTIAVFASGILEFLVCHFDYHDFILQNHKNIIPNLFQSLHLEDFQLQICVTKMLMYLSAGSSPFREKIIQEDLARNSVLLYLLNGTCSSVLINTTCIIANLALSIDQTMSHQYIRGLCDLLYLVDDSNAELLAQLGRGLANFSESPANVLLMIHHLPTFVSKLLKSNFEVPKVHACRMIVYLFSSEMSCTLDVLAQSGLSDFIGTVFDLPGITDILSNLFLRKASRLSVCH